MANVSERAALQVRITQFDGARERGFAVHTLPATDGEPLRAAFAGARWEIAAALEPVPDRTDAVDGRITFRVVEGAAREVAVAVEFEQQAWSREVFVLLPAAALIRVEFDPDVFVQTMYAMLETLMANREPAQRLVVIAPAVRRGA